MPPLTWRWKLRSLGSTLREWLSRFEVVSQYLYFKQIPKLFDGQLSWKPTYKEWPNKTLWGSRQGRLWWNFILGRKSKRKMRGKEEQALGCLTKKENWMSNKYHLSHSLPWPAAGPGCSCVACPAMTCPFDQVLIIPNVYFRVSYEQMNAL